MTSLIGLAIQRNIDKDISCSWRHRCKQNKTIFNCPFFLTTAISKENCSMCSRGINLFPSIALKRERDKMHVNRTASIKVQFRAPQKKEKMIGLRENRKRCLSETSLLSFPNLKLHTNKKKRLNGVVRPG